MRLGSFSLVVVTCLVLAGNSLAPAQIVSDDFDAYNLKTSLWTFIDPLGDATLTLNGTGTSDATLSLAVPAGSSHDLWTTGYKVPRIMQSAPNTDFEVEVKFQSNLTAQNQMQGVIIEQDSVHLLRVEFNNDGTGVNIFAASFSGGLGSPVVRLSSSLGTISQPFYLRIHRTGNTWTISRSGDGSAWVSAGNFSDTLAVTRIGLFAGNSGGGTVPAQTAIIDYFFNTASPVTPEDSGSVTDNIPPLIYDATVVPTGSGLRISWKTDELATGTVVFGKTLSYEGGTESHPGMALTHEVTLTGLTPSTLYNLRITSNDGHLNSTTTGNIAATTSAGLTITVWYGKTQTFGKIGVPQRNADILGRVSGPNKIDSLSYRLNGGVAKSLSIGPDGRLLEQKGDFKINLPFADLLSGANSLIINAKDSTGVTAADTMTVLHTPGNVWPQPYSVNWSDTTSLTDSAQIVDGEWQRIPQGAHTAVAGYDRSIVIGDTSWTDYEVTAEFTVNQIDSTAEAFSSVNAGPAFGFILRWVGHTNSPTFNPPITQPASGYLPLGALGSYHWGRGFGLSNPNRWELLGNNLALRDSNTSASNALQYGTKYVVKMQSNSVLASGWTYRLKFWKAGEVEPDSWLLSGLETSADPQHGSILIVAHYVDLTIGRVTVEKFQDIVAPLFTQIQAAPGAHSAYVTWGTNEPASSRVAYGTTTAHSDTVSGGGAKTNSHGLLLSGLTPTTMYHFLVISTDTAGNTGVSSDSTFTTVFPPPPSTFVSDEFNAATLDTSRWKFVNPTPPGGGSVAKQPTTVTLHVPAGVAHDFWTNGYQVPRLMQSVNNSDFNLEVKFNSVLGPQFQSQGIVVEQDSANVIRMDFYGNGSQTKLFVATFSEGFSSPVIRADSLVGETGIQPLFMRVQREDDGWVISYSLDGTLWKSLPRFHHAMTVHKVGLWAGNGGGTPPAFDAIVDYFRSVRPVAAGVVVKLKVLLEGAYSVASDTMRTKLASFLPTHHPYGGAPWNYTGSDSVSVLPATVVDWVLLELRSDAAPSSIVARRAAFLEKNGSVVDLDGSKPVSFPSVPAGNYYLVVRHRNHLAVMSAAKVMIDSASVLYDFTTGQSKAYGGNAMKSLGSRFGLYAGDANMDGQVTSLDFDQFNPKFRAAATGYQSTDWNLDGQVTSLDFDMFNPNFGAAAVSRVPK